MILAMVAVLAANAALAVYLIREVSNLKKELRSVELAAKQPANSLRAPL